MNLRAALTLCAALWLPAAFADDDEAPILRLSYAPQIETTIKVQSPADAAGNAALPAVELGEPAKAALPIDLTAEYDDLWERVRHGFSMPNLDNELVRRHQIWYMNRPDYLRRVVERSRRYMHYIIEEIEKRGLPTELALLPIVESSYNPMALSTARASGLWQFIPSTGKTYKLDQTWWVDERRDIVASTAAALDYLKYIYEMHGDWQLALASYNWGEGAVGRAIAKNKAKGLPTDYSSLKMPKETQNYVPKLQALKNILGNPGLWAMLNMPEVPNKPYFSSIPKPADMDVKVAAKLAEMPVNEFVALNPAHNRPLIRGNIPLVLPADKVDTFRANLEEHDDPLSSWQSYTFARGDKIEKLAARFGISVAQLKSINGLSGRKTRVLPGQMLLVPSRNGGGATDLADFSAPIGGPEEPVLSRKAKAAQAAAEKLARKKGRHVIVAKASPAEKKKTVASVSKKSTALTRYTVRHGDTLASIARKFNVEVRDIAKHNRVRAGIKPGQQLLIAALG